MGDVIFLSNGEKKSDKPPIDQELVSALKWLLKKAKKGEVQGIVGLVITKDRYDSLIVMPSDETFDRDTLAAISMFDFIKKRLLIDTGLDFQQDEET